MIARICAVAAALCLFVPCEGRADVSSNPTISLTWDGKLLTDAEREKLKTEHGLTRLSPVFQYAKLSFSMSSGCSGATSTAVGLMPLQPNALTTLESVTNVTCSSDTPCSYGSASHASPTDSMVSFDAYVHAGAAYLFLGRAECTANLSWSKPVAYSPVILIPPVFSSFKFTSKKTLKTFNKLKVGESLKISFEEYNQEELSSAEIPIKKTLIVEGAGVTRREYDVRGPPDLRQEGLKDITPTEAGTLTLRLRIQGYVYYSRHTHNVQFDWTDYDWNAATAGKPDLYTADYQSLDQLCDEHGLPKYQAESYEMISAPVEIPVLDSWCLTQASRSSPFWGAPVDPNEGCDACSAVYNDNAPSYDEEAMCPGSGDSKDKGSNSSSGGGGGCSSVGAGGSAILAALALSLLVRQRRSQPSQPR